MAIKLILFLVILPITVVVLNSVSVVYNIFSVIGYWIIASVVGWEVTSRVVDKINTSGVWKVNPTRKIVLITGCDSGFGYLTAKQLNSYGFTVLASCLFPEGECAKRLSAEVDFPENLIIIGCDVTKDEDIDNVYQRVNDYVKSGYELWGLVNNAGIAAIAEIEWSTFAHNFGKIFEVNCYGVVKVTRKCLPLIRRSKGRVVIVSSIVGRVTHSQTLAYSMTKHALVSFADGLRLSMRKFGVKVICIEPCPYSTPIITRTYQRSKELWEETDISIRNDYGENYCTELIQAADSYPQSLMNTNLHEVSDAIVDALVCPFPNLRQTCGVFGFRFAMSLLSIIPSDFTYFLMKNM